jgi:hypothetical protein
MRVSAQQRQRTQDNPLDLGTFDRTSLRYLKGSLGPKNQIVGRADTNQNSNGGFGGGTYNHWFKVNLKVPAWIIAVKGPPRPQYIQVSAYSLDQVPIEGRSIFGADSVTEINDGIVYHPYVGHIMGAQSDLYNNFAVKRLDQGDDRYFTLNPGSYLICISTTRNEPLDYELGLVIEVEDTIFELLLETGGQDKFVYENSLDTANTLNIGPTVSSDYTLPVGFNGYTAFLATIESTVTVTLSDGSTWLIDQGQYDPTAFVNQDFIILDATENYTGQDTHQHSLSEWQEAWERDHQQDNRFPALFIPLTTTS